MRRTFFQLFRLIVGTIQYLFQLRLFPFRTIALSKMFITCNRKVYDYHFMKFSQIPQLSQLNASQLKKKKKSYTIDRNALGITTIDYILQIYLILKMYVGKKYQPRLNYLDIPEKDFIKNAREIEKNQVTRKLAYDNTRSQHSQIDPPIQNEIVIIF